MTAITNIIIHKTKTDLQGTIISLAMQSRIHDPLACQQSDE